MPVKSQVWYFGREYLGMNFDKEYQKEYLLKIKSPEWDILP